MLQSGFTSVLEADDRDQLLTEIVRFTQSLGFETVSAMTVIDHLLGEAEFITVDNTPSDYRDAFIDMGRARVDPVVLAAHALVLVGLAVAGTLLAFRTFKKRLVI